MIDESTTRSWVEWHMRQLAEGMRELHARGLTEPVKTEFGTARFETGRGLVDSQGTLHWIYDGTAPKHSRVVYHSPWVETSS